MLAQRLQNIHFNTIIGLFVFNKTFVLEWQHHIIFNHILETDTYNSSSIGTY